jgi:hypothetical protein
MTILTKRAAESRRYTMDLSNLPEFAAGDTIASVTYVHCTTAVGTGGSTTDLTLGTISIHAGNKGVDVEMRPDTALSSGDETRVVTAMGMWACVENRPSAFQPGGRVVQREMLRSGA